MSAPKKSPPTVRLYKTNAALWELAGHVVSLGLVRHKSVSKYIQHLIRQDVLKRGSKLKERGISLPESVTVK